MDRSRPVRFLYLIGLVDRGIQRQLRRILAPLELSIPEYTTLAVLEVEPGLSNADLARRSMVRPQSMNEVIARLEERALVERSQHPAHGRILMAEVTDAGRALLGQAMPRIADLEAALLVDIPDAERPKTRGYLLDIMRRLRELE